MKFTKFKYGRFITKIYHHSSYIFLHSYSCSSQKSIYLQRLYQKLTILSYVFTPRHIYPLQVGATITECFEGYVCDLGTGVEVQLHQTGTVSAQSCACSVKGLKKKKNAFHISFKTLLLDIIRMGISISFKTMHYISYSRLL